MIENPRCRAIAHPNGSKPEAEEEEEEEKCKLVCVCVCVCYGYVEQSERIEEGNAKKNTNVLEFDVFSNGEKQSYSKDYSSIECAFENKPRKWLDNTRSTFAKYRQTGSEGRDGSAGVMIHSRTPTRPPRILGPNRLKHPSGGAELVCACVRSASLSTATLGSLSVHSNALLKCTRTDDPWRKVAAPAVVWQVVKQLKCIQNGLWLFDRIFFAFDSIRL